VFGSRNLVHHVKCLMGVHNLSQIAKVSKDIMVVAHYHTCYMCIKVKGGRLHHFSNPMM
jgi:hypothetical protein